jgi:guanylate cyclase soluble subunit beta
MYGMIHKAIRDMVKTVHGEEAWRAVLTESGAADGDFLSLRAYDDDIAYNLVGACSTILGASPAACLEDFGRFWILVTASQHYGDMMRSYGQDSFGLLNQMNEMHERISTTFSGYKPPHFTVEMRDETTCSLHYRSVRQGLSPFVIGLVLGLGEFYGEAISIDLESTNSEGGGEYSVFKVTRTLPAGT